MRLATLRSGHRDGLLAVVSRDGARLAPATGIARSLQEALDDWGAREPRLRALAADLDAGRVEGTPLVPDRLHAPLPRAFEWVDGSAYLNHVRLVRRARGAEPPPGLERDPLLYQGGAGANLGPTEPIPAGDAAWGLDLEAEVCCVLGDVPRGATAADGPALVRLLCLANDVTFRGLVPAELAKGFGFFQSKPATAFSPLAVTPDELGPAWRDGRAHLTLSVRVNGRFLGACETGPEMHFGFFELLQHAARTRSFTAGTILGGGTVSNADPARGACCLQEVRAREMIEGGRAATPFLAPGDRIEIEARDAAGRSPFGAIDQRVVP